MAGVTRHLQKIVGDLMEFCIVSSDAVKDCGRLLEKIYRGQCVSQQYSREMLNLFLSIDDCHIMLN